jgi:hypothetical protein
MIYFFKFRNLVCAKTVIELWKMKKELGILSCYFTDLITSNISLLIQFYGRRKLSPKFCRLFGLSALRPLNQELFVLNKNNTSIRSQPLFAKSCPVCKSSVILYFDALTNPVYESSVILYFDALTNPFYESSVILHFDALTNVVHRRRPKFGPNIDGSL